mmetsp:Transcript_83490/g.232936  ORF Transcript_83490/g.232936 Transcript_83490/m.232936 type:complete len:210 (-) Transcript_83490:172-801(-)
MLSSADEPGPDLGCVAILRGFPAGQRRRYTSHRTSSGVGGSAAEAVFSIGSRVAKIAASFACGFATSVGLTAPAAACSAVRGISWTAVAVVHAAIASVGGTMSAAARGVDGSAAATVFAVASCVGVGFRPIAKLLPVLGLWLRVHALSSFHCGLTRGGSDATAMHTTDAGGFAPARIASRPLRGAASGRDWPEDATGAERTAWHRHQLG